MTIGNFAEVVPCLFLMVVDKTKLPQARLELKMLILFSVRLSPHDIIFHDILDLPTEKRIC